MTDQNPTSQHDEPQHTMTERIRGLIRGILDRGRPEHKPDAPTPSEPGR